MDFLKLVEMALEHFGEIKVRKIEGAIVLVKPMEKDTWFCFYYPDTEDFEVSIVRKYDLATEIHEKNVFVY